MIDSLYSLVERVMEEQQAKAEHERRDNARVGRRRLAEAQRLEGEEMQYEHSDS